MPSDDCGESLDCGESSIMASLRLWRVSTPQPRQTTAFASDCERTASSRLATPTKITSTLRNYIPLQQIDGTSVS